MLVLVGKGHYFGLDAGTITGTDTLYLAVVKRRVGQSAAQYFMSLRVGLDCVTRALRKLSLHIGKIGKLMKIIVAFLQGGH